MSEKELLPLGLITALLANPIVVAIGLILIAILFIVGYVFLWAWGLVTAAVFFVAGIFLLFILTRVDKEILKRYPLLSAIPLGLGVAGYVIDHVPRLSMLSLAGNSSVAVDSAVVAVIILGIAMLLLVIAVKGKKKKRR
jgi:hypothetical protein